MTERERQQAISFQDRIGEIVDEYLKEGMSPLRVSVALHDESGMVLTRKLTLESEE